MSNFAYTTEARERALDALTTWRTRTDDRDALVRTAHRLGASQLDIAERAKLTPKTVRSILTEPEQEAPAMPTNTTDADPLADFHHPHFLRDLGPDVPGGRFMFRPFTGHETNPSELFPDNLPADDAERAAELVMVLSAEYGAARREWQTARFESAARPVLTEAAEVWRRYRRSCEDMDAASLALNNTPDNAWKRSVLALYDTQQATLELAEQWDTTALRLIRLEEDERDNFAFTDPADIPTLTDIATRLGIDASQWIFGFGKDDYPNRDNPAWVSPAVKRSREAIEAQNQRVRAVAAMTGDEAAPVKLTGSALLHRGVEIMLRYQATGMSTEDRAGYLSMTNGDERAHAVVRLYASLDSQWRTKATADEAATVAAAYDHATMAVEAFRHRHH